MVPPPESSAFVTNLCASSNKLGGKEAIPERRHYE